MSTRTCLILRLTSIFTCPQRDKAARCLACPVTLKTGGSVATQTIMKTSPGHASLDTLGHQAQALPVTTPMAHLGVNQPSPL